MALLGCYIGCWFLDSSKAPETGLATRTTQVLGRFLHVTGGTLYSSGTAAAAQAAGQDPTLRFLAWE